MRNNKKRYVKKVKMVTGENKEKEENKHIVLEVHNSNLNSKSNEINGGN
jgi:hypothetical protein